MYWKSGEIAEENIKAKNRNFSILNSSAPSQNNNTSRTSCRRLFENFYLLRQHEITFEKKSNVIVLTVLFLAEKLTDKSYFLSQPVCIFRTREKFAY